MPNSYLSSHIHTHEKTRLHISRRQQTLRLLKGTLNKHQYYGPIIHILSLCWISWLNDRVVFIMFFLIIIVLLCRVSGVPASQNIYGATVRGNLHFSDQMPAADWQWRHHHGRHEHCYVTPWKHFSHYWRVVMKIHHHQQITPNTRGLLLLIWISCWSNSRNARALRRSITLTEAAMSSGSKAWLPEYCSGSSGRAIVRYGSNEW